LASYPTLWKIFRLKIKIIEKQEHILTRNLMWIKFTAAGYAVGINGRSVPLGQIYDV
jgi:hypothetical protein